MKKSLQFYIGLTLLGSTCFAQEFIPMHGDQHNYVQQGGNNSPQFTTDVAIAPGNTLRQRGTSITVAFNGWIYEATKLETVDSDSSGGLIRMSKDNGFTWTAFASYLYPNVDYLQPEIEVAGTDTNNLSLFITSAWYDSISGAADVWIDKYDGRTSAFISEVYNESMQYPVRDVDIATDYKFPAFTTSPYSVALLYSHFGSMDSLIFVSSGDGGTTWNNRRAIAGTSAYMDQVSLAYGISSNWWIGRYFAAWEERTSFTAATIGKIKFARTQSSYDGTWSSPISLDSLDPSISGMARRPSIACHYNSTVNNDSTAITVAVVFERAYTGDTSDCDILGFYSKTQPATQNWYRFDVVNAVTQTLQPDIAYDPVYNNFLLTYFDRSQQRMPYLVHEFNMLAPYSWVVITNNYCDQPATLQNPFPRVTINPALTQAAFSWTRMTGIPVREQAMFDAEYMITAVPDSAFSPLTAVVYPNPASTDAWFAFDLKNEQEVRIDIYSENGELVMNLADQSMNEGAHRIVIPVDQLTSGMYTIAVTTANGRSANRFVVMH